MQSTAAAAALTNLLFMKLFRSKRQARRQKEDIMFIKQAEAEGQLRNKVLFAVYFERLIET